MTAWGFAADAGTAPSSIVVMTNVNPSVRLEAMVPSSRDTGMGAATPTVLVADYVL